MRRRAKNPEQSLSIGEVARMAGVNVQTVRYYERRKLVPTPPRLRSGYRAYPLETVSLIRFIKRARELGFGLGEIDELLHLQKMSGSRSEEIAGIATEKLRTIDERRTRLGALRNALEELVKKSREHDPIEPWLIVDALNE
jgi:DNA-binding transcriptional MerR regulator